jgi:hypothetical protein
LVKAKLLGRTEELGAGGIRVGGIPGDSRIKETGLELRSEGIEGLSGGRSRGSLRLAGGIAEAEHGGVH